MLFFTNEIMRDLLSKSLQTAALVDGVWKDSERGPASRAAEYIEWLTIRDQTQSVIDDVERIKSHPSFRAKSRFTVRLRRRDGSAERGCSS
jgi:carbonic anhydrase